MHQMRVKLIRFQEMVKATEESERLHMALQRTLRDEIARLQKALQEQQKRKVSEFL